MSGSRTDWIQVSTGYYHTCGIRDESWTGTYTLWCWGDDDSDQLGDSATGDQPEPIEVDGGFTDWIQLSAGSYHTCGIRDIVGAKTAFCWGWNGFGQLGDAGGGNRSTPWPVSCTFTDWLQLSAGVNHTCGVRDELFAGNTFTTWCWGENSAGQVGDNTIINRDAPVKVTGGYTDWVQVSGGEWHTCGIRGDTGQPWCWGYNAYGQLGDGSGGYKPYPVIERGGSTNWFYVNAGRSHVCGIKTDGTLWCWGRNDDGQLGIGDTDDRSVPKQIGASTDWQYVDAGDFHSCGVRDESGNLNLYCWGDNSQYQLGDNGVSGGNSTVPVQEFMGYTNWDAITLSAGAYHNCCIRDNAGDRTAWCWGDSGSGQAGDGISGAGNYVEYPIEVTGGYNDWVTISAGGWHTCGIRDEYSAGLTFTIWCWGNNFFGQLGNTGYPSGSTWPVKEEGGSTDWWQVSAGNSHTCGIKNDQTLWCWGDNEYGQIGNGSGSDEPVPVQVGTESDWQDVSVGMFHTCGVRSDGGQWTIWCWGLNSSRQLGVGDYTDRSVPTQVGAATGWADQIAAGNYQSCALKGSGGNNELWCFGSNVYGQLGDGTGWYTYPVLTQTMVPIPAGCFDMGDNFDEGDIDEVPVHYVCITSDFQLSKFEVTNAQYRTCVSTGSCSALAEIFSDTRFPYYGVTAYDNYPLINVTWDQAKTYCEWLATKLGTVMRLPREAEWEYASRGGLVGKRYPWGNADPDLGCTLGPLTLNGAHYSPCSPNDTIEVGSHAPNGFGLFDMAGNVWEWVSDYHDNNYYNISPQDDPENTTPGVNRVRRGGGFDLGEYFLRNANRNFLNPSDYGFQLGFRCARE